MDQNDLVVTIVSALGVVVASFVSGLFLLIIHHSKVKQELDIHRENELFDKKQKSVSRLTTNTFKNGR